MTLQEFADRIKEAWSGVSETIEKFAESIRKIFEKFYTDIHERLLFRPPKRYSKVNNHFVIVNKSKIYRCRNNC